MSTIDDAIRAPRVFVSYSHDSREHMDRVLVLCDRLRDEGVEAELDQYEPVPPEGWPLWTARKVERADFVLAVCTETYRRRFDGHEETGKGLGVRWEGAVVAQALYEAGAQNDKFLPVLFSPTDEPHIPLVLRATSRFLVSEEGGYEQLYRYLTAQPAAPPPELGTRRALPPRPRVADFSSSEAEHFDGNAKLASEPRRFRWTQGIVAAVLSIALVTFLIQIFTRENNPPSRPDGSVVAAPSVLKGEISDALTRELLAGVEVRLPEYRLKQTTGNDGQYYFEIPPPSAASIKLRAKKAGYGDLNLDLPPVNHLHVHTMRNKP